MHNAIRRSVTATMCVAVAAIAFAGNATAGPMTMVSSSIRKTPSATEQIYYHRHGGYYRHGYAYGPRYYHGRPVYGYGYPYAHPVVPVPLPVPFFGWGTASREFFGVQGGSSDSRCRPPKKASREPATFFLPRSERFVSQRKAYPADLGLSICSRRGVPAWLAALRGLSRLIMSQ